MIRRVVAISVSLILISISAWVLYGMLNTSANVYIGQAALNARIATSESERRQGLSGSNPLGDTDAMLFVFPSDDMWGIWMKDMKYPIDIVWLDSSKTVRFIVENASPDSYPVITFRPDTPVRYVVEMKAGTVKHKSITMGTKAELGKALEESK